MGTPRVRDAGMLEAEESASYPQPISPSAIEENRRLEQQEMEERNKNSSTIIETEEATDYRNRTRTNRERKALHTGGNASDDQ